MSSWSGIRRHYKYHEHSTRRAPGDTASILHIQKLPRASEVSPGPDWQIYWYPIGLPVYDGPKKIRPIEKAWFANQEDLKEHGFTSAQDLIQTATTKTLRGETADQLDAIFGRGFSKKSVTSRIRIMDQMGDQTDIQSALADRPEEVLAKRLAASTSAIGQTVVPVLNTILGAFLKISDAIAKIPGLNSVIGWGTVLTATAAAGLAMTSILGGMVSNFRILRVALAESVLAEYAHTAAMWLGSAAAAARAAVTGVLTTVTGLLTGEVTLSSIVMAGWNAIMAAGAVVAGIFNLSMLPIIAVMGAAALLIGLVAHKSGLLQAVLKTLSNINLGRIFKDLRMGDLSKAWNDLAKGFKAPQLDLNLGLQGSTHRRHEAQEWIAKMGLDLVSIVSPFGSMLKAALTIQDTLRRIWFNSDYLNKIVSTGLGIWQKMLDLFSWLLGTVRDLQKWLATAMPGAEKEAARKKMVKQGQAEGLRPGKENGQNVWYTKGGLRGKPSSKLLEMQKEYEDLPGFAEGVANAVAEGMKGVANSIGTSVGNAIKDWAPQINLPEIKIPDISILGMDTLATAIKTLSEKLDKLFQGLMGGTEETLPRYTKKQFSYDGQSWGFDPKKETFFVHEVDPASSNEFTRDVNINKVPNKVRKHFMTKEKYKESTKFASGATFISGGMFLGRVDQTEEIIPQAITQRGAGPISRMLAIINEVSPSSGPGQGDQRDAVYAPNYVNIHIDRIEKDVDIDKLLFRIRDELDNHATRTIGYLRG